MMKRTAIAFLLLAASGLTQEPPPAVSGPVLGYALHAGSLRALYGIPGAVTWGPAIVTGLDSAAVSPAQDVAIACGGGRVFLAPVDRPDERIDLLGVTCTRLVFSERGRAAVIHDESAQRLIVITGLPAAPLISREIEWAGALSAVAVTDDGARLLVAADEGAFEVSGDGARLALPGVGPASTATIAGQRVWISQRDEPVALEIDLGGEATSIRRSATVPRASALALSRDASMLAVIDRDTRRFFLWHIARGEAVPVEGSCEGDSLQALNGNAVFRLVANGGGSCIVDADREVARVFLVPGPPQ